MRILVPKNASANASNRVVPTSTTTTTTTTTTTSNQHHHANNHHNANANVNQNANQNTQNAQRQQPAANERNINRDERRAPKQQAISDNSNNHPVRKVASQKQEKSNNSEGYNSDDEVDKTTRKQPTLSTIKGGFYEDAQGVLCKDIKVNNKKLRLNVRKMAEDGNCLFRAIADQVYGDQEMHGSVRKLCMDYIQAERDHYSQFVTEDFEAYLNRKRRSKCFGNNIEIQAISELYNRPIEVYTDEPTPLNIFHSSYNTDNPPMRLWYNGINHYNSLVDPYAATIGVGLGLPDFKPGLLDKMQLDQAINVSEEEELEKRYLAELQKEADWEDTERELEEAAIAASLAEYWQSAK
eukprot:TRINITY_DN9018_c0_g1_i1.p1 TRINITY_DN9018_c0_g1~~TRINITY_DN9018_c0_g1_i1.p1  ORF type:complete len:353 (+),score=85.14 TRINITY_DN9018_c0_g1_i1:243-1301(+)